MIGSAHVRWSNVMLSSAGNHGLVKQWSLWLFLIALLFTGLHVLQWSVQCGPLASGKYRDYCADLDRVRQARAVVINEATQARSKAVARTPYVDLRDGPETLEQFVPPGYGITKNRANVRDGPGMLFAVIDSLAPDSMVEIIEETDGWIRIRLNEPGDAESFGWVWRDLLAR